MAGEHEEGLFCWGLCFYFGQQHSGCGAGEKHCRWVVSTALPFPLPCAPLALVHLSLHTVLQVSQNYHLPIPEMNINTPNIFLNTHLSCPKILSGKRWAGSLWCCSKLSLFPWITVMQTQVFVFPLQFRSVETGSLIFWVFSSDGIARLYFKGTAGNVWYSESSSWVRRKIILESWWGKLVGLNWHTPYKGKLVNQDRKCL